jgi:DNA-binding PadR family transcriptional regulator
MKQRELASLGVLGGLAEEDVATVDRIRDKLQHNFGRYWGASSGILVPTISKLEEDEHVETVRAGEEYGYEITSTGRDRLKTLLRKRIEDISHPSYRAHLMLKLGFLHHLSPDEQEGEIESLQDQLLEARDRLLTLEVRHEEGVESSRNTGYRRHLIDLRVGIIDAFLDWLEDVKRSMT